MICNNYVKSLSQFMNELYKKMDQINKIENNNNSHSIWFRGEGSEDYDLVPGLYRNEKSGENKYWKDVFDCNKIKQIEDNIDVSFIRKSVEFLAEKKIDNTHWNRYFLKQHYGVKTRLLDWTENALYALFFALTDKNEIAKSKSARVWLLSPHKLNNYSVNKLTAIEKNAYHIYTTGTLEKKGLLINELGELRANELIRKYYRLDFNKNEIAHPIAIYPPHLDSRMSAQQACFTVFGNIIKGLNMLEQKEKILEFVSIDFDSKQKILNELRLLGISYYSVYPDLDGLGKTINYDHIHEILSAKEQNEFSIFFDELNS